MSPRRFHGSPPVYLGAARQGILRNATCDNLNDAPRELRYVTRSGSLSSIQSVKIVRWSIKRASWEGNGSDGDGRTTREDLNSAIPDHSSYEGIERQSPRGCAGGEAPSAEREALSCGSVDLAKGVRFPQ